MNWWWLEMWIGKRGKVVGGTSKKQIIVTDDVIPTTSKAIIP